jgi:peptidoglycan-associated lipoprotein
MKIPNFSILLLLGVLCSLGVTGCKKTPKGTTPIFDAAARVPRGDRNPSGMENPSPAVPLNNDNTRATPLPGSLGGDEQSALGPREELGDYFLDRDTFNQQTVYFDYDRFNLKPGEMTKAQSVATHLQGEPNLKVLVEGHCDERGTPEYNRALGERRALSIRESLINLGVPGDRIQTISYGEDKPADSSQSDAAYAKNRRGEFVLMKPKSGGSAAEFR